MKRTMTATLQDLRSGQLARKLSLGHDNCTISITYDDGTPAFKTVWEWMVEVAPGQWDIVNGLYSEEEAARTLKDPRKKLREFHVEVGE